MGLELLTAHRHFNILVSQLPIPGRFISGEGTPSRRLGASKLVSNVWQKEKSCVVVNWTLDRLVHSLIIDWLNILGSQQPKGKGAKLTANLQLRSGTRGGYGKLTCITEIGPSKAWNQGPICHSRLPSHMPTCMHYNYHATPRIQRKKPALTWFTLQLAAFREKLTVS